MLVPTPLYSFGASSLIRVKSRLRLLSVKVVSFCREATLATTLEMALPTKANVDLQFSMADANVLVFLVRSASCLPIQFNCTGISEPVLLIEHTSKIRLSVMIPIEA